MKRSIATAMKVMALLTGFSGMVGQSLAQDGGAHIYHGIQHGFVLSEGDKFASHLVANAHHSRQVEITGQLSIDDQQELETYQERRLKSDGTSYFIFQAQNLDLPSLSPRQVLTGHIVESKVGFYEPQNIIVRSAVFHVQEVLLNIPNPFFAIDTHLNSTNHSKCSLRQDSHYSHDLMDNTLNEGAHCCDTGKKPCNWKC